MSTETRAGTPTLEESEAKCGAPHPFSQFTCILEPGHDGHHNAGVYGPYALEKGGSDA